VKPVSGRPVKIRIISLTSSVLPVPGFIARTAASGTEPWTAGRMIGVSIIATAFASASV
jgi:hypothetical protein